MKRGLMAALYILGFFLVVAVIVLPEYRVRSLIALFIYCGVLVLALRMTSKSELVSFYYTVFNARLKYIMFSSLIFVLMLILGVLSLNLTPFTKKRIDLTSKGAFYLSQKSLQYIDTLDKEVDVIYIRPINSDDYRSYFNAIMEEIKDHNSSKINYKTLHPVLNTIEYNKIKNKVPSLSPGNFVVTFGDDYLVGERVNEREIIRSINRLLSGQLPICYTSGHGEPSIDDFSESGGALMNSMLADRGVILSTVPVEEWKDCRVIFIAEPSKDFSDQEISALNDYGGNIIIFGGTKLPSIKNFIETNGFMLGSRKEPSFRDYALREYEGGMVLDKFYEHPLLAGIKGGVAISGGSAIECNDCIPLAGIDESIMYAGKKGVILFSGEKSTSNFFMRFSGNFKLIYNALYFSFSPDSYMLFIDDKEDDLGFFAISPRFLNIMFWLCVVGFPFLLLSMGVYCFKNTRPVKIK